MVRAALLVLVASLAEGADLHFADVRASAPLSAWDLGRVRLYLETNATVCLYPDKDPVEAAYPIHLEVAATGKARRVDVRGPRKLGRCLARVLREVGFPSAAEAYRWDGVLRVGLPAGVLGVMILRFERRGPLSELILENAVLARLEDMPACARDALGGGLSVALRGALDIDEGGTTRARIELSTDGPKSLVECLDGHLGGLRLPEAKAASHVDMFFHLVQPVVDPDPTIPRVVEGPK